MENAKQQNIWQLQRTIAYRLLAWSGYSMGAGLALLAGGPFWRGFGLQAISWGAIDAVIALAGLGLAGRRASLPDPDGPETVARETRNLTRLLWINTGLDVFYVLGGLVLARTKGAADRGWRGHGWGIVVQGGFLFLFDLYHARRLGRGDTGR